MQELASQLAHKKIMYLSERSCKASLGQQLKKAIKFM